jgi:hypothetical protein
VLLAAGYYFVQGQPKIMSGGREMAASEKEVRVILEQTAGSYDTTVIRGTSAAAVNDWLTGHGFLAFEGRDLKVLEDYIARKWVFFCARITTAGKGVKETHPLTVRFPAAEPVYPMRLTESAGTVPLDLFVIGESFAMDPSGRLEPWRTLDFSKKRFFHRVEALSTALKMQQTMRGEVAGGASETDFKAEYLPFVPAGRDVFLDTLMAGGTHITHLKHTFKPGDDWGDIKLEPSTEPAPPRPHFTLAGYMEQILIWLGFAPAEVGKRPHRAWGLTMAILLIGAWSGTALFAWKNVIIVPAGRVASSRSMEPESGHGQFMIWMKKLSASPAAGTP